MASAACRSIALAGLALFTCLRGLAGQCPDGTPPPCRAPAAPPAVRGPVDENLIAIFPFRITGTSSDAASLREGAMDLLGLALDEQAGLRVVPSRTLLARARGFTDATPVAEAAALARGLGAGTMILGNAVVAGAQVRAHAEMHDLVRGRPVVSVEARGAAADPAPVIDSLAYALARRRLASGAGTTRRSIQEFSTTSPQALRAYLAGERLARGGRWQEAADSLQRAIVLDSTFGLAYYRLRIANTFGADVGARTALQLIETALRFADRLPRRQRDVLGAVAAMSEGNSTEAMRLGDALGERYPDDVEAAYEQGETYFHMGLSLGEPPARALAAYDRAIRLDSSFIDPYNHAVELRVMTGDTAGAWALSRRALEIAPTSGVHLATWLAMRAVRGEAPAAVSAEFLRSHPAVIENINVVGRAAQEVWRCLTNDPGRALRLAESFYAAASAPDLSRSERLSPLVGRVRTLIALGRYREVRDAVAQLQQLDAAAAAQAQVLMALLGHGSLAEPLGQLRRQSVMPGTIVNGTVISWAAIVAGDGGLADSAGQALEAEADLRGFRATLAAGLRGLAALHRGDSAAARTLLARAVGMHPYSTRLDAQAEFALALARLESSRDAGAAAGRLSEGVFSDGIVLRRADMEELRAQIAVQQGDTATAVRSYRNFIGLWQNADPELQPRVAAARAALARLESR